MPKVTKDTKKEELNKKSTKTSNSSKNRLKSTTTVVKSSSKKSSVSTKTTRKNTSSSKKKKVTSASKVKKIEENIVAEYYDLPYRYNETMVKILYQTPTILFVYWDISDEDRKSFINQYGNNFFDTTYPVLKIYNLTKNYDFEIPINDFANSWYIHVNDAGCDYKVELFRKPIETNNNSYIFVSCSNDIEFPNDHILLEELPNTIHFKNVKTNEINSKDISTLHLVGIKEVHNIYDFYKKLYKDEILEEINSKKLINPSSSSSWNI